MRWLVPAWILILHEGFTERISLVCTATGLFTKSLTNEHYLLSGFSRIEANSLFLQMNIPCVLCGKFRT